MKRLFLLACLLLFSACSSHITSTAVTLLPPPQVAITHHPTSTPIPPPTTPTATPTPITTPRPWFYTVQPGDTLSHIAIDQHTTVDILALINQLSNPNSIFAGMVLILPNAPTTATPSLTSGKEIVVDISLQRTYAYENGQLIKEFIVSTGVPQHPTVLGVYHIYIKLLSTTMTGPDYHLTNVPYTMYFFQGYSFHGTYWHHNFGHPMSHGCINMSTDDAKWLFDWAPLDTLVTIFL